MQPVSSILILFSHISHKKLGARLLKMDIDSLFA
jgi:hypothetical protein